MFVVLCHSPFIAATHTVKCGFRFTKFIRLRWCVFYTHFEVLCGSLYWITSLVSRSYQKKKLTKIGAMGFGLWVSTITAVCFFCCVSFFFLSFFNISFYFIYLFNFKSCFPIASEHVCGGISLNCLLASLSGVLFLSLQESQTLLETAEAECRALLHRLLPHVPLPTDQVHNANNSTLLKVYKNKTSI